MKVYYWLAGFILVGLGIAASLYAGHRLSAALPYPVGNLPTDLPGYTLAFPSQNGAKLAAWFIPGQPGKGALLLLHGSPGTRESMLGRAKFLHKQGYALLLVDQQAHGESEGERITFGYRESGDAVAAVKKLAELAPGERLGAIGVSLGAASLVLGDAYQQLSALVLESLYPTIEQAVDDRMALHLGPIGPLFSPLLLWQLEPRLGVPRAALRPIERLPLVTKPVLLAHGMNDQHTLFTEAKALYRALPGPKMFYAVPNAAHVDLHAFASSEYETRIGAFFAHHIQRQPMSHTNYARH